MFTRKFNLYTPSPKRSYTPHYFRHVYSMAINGFYAPDLDADDYAFLEHVRDHGTVSCGSLADPIPTAWHDGATRMPLAEELQYWETPWDREAGIARRLGNKPVMNEQYRLAREEADRIRRERWIAIRLQREADKAVMAAELAREQEEWEQLQAKLAHEREARMLQTMQADLEWENAALDGDEDDEEGERRWPVPPARPFYPAEKRYTGPRFYEPLWKAEDRLAERAKSMRQYAKSRKREERTMKAAAAEKAKLAAEAAKLAAEAAEKRAAGKVAKLEAAAAATTAAAGAREAAATEARKAAEAAEVATAVRTAQQLAALTEAAKPTEAYITAKTLEVFWSLPPKLWEPLVRAALGGPVVYSRVKIYLRSRQVLPEETQRKLDMFVAPWVLTKHAATLIGAAQRWNHD